MLISPFSFFTLFIFKYFFHNSSLPRWIAKHNFFVFIFHLNIEIVFSFIHTSDLDALEQKTVIFITLLFFYVMLMDLKYVLINCYTGDRGTS